MPACGRMSASTMARHRSSSAARAACANSSSAISMSDATAGTPPLRLPRPQRREARPLPAPDGLVRWWRWSTAPIIALGHGQRGRALRRILAPAAASETRLAALDDAALARTAWQAGAELRRRPGARGFAEVAAVVREAVRRATGLRLNDRQLEGGYALWLGMIAEMQTGEGKTLTAVLPAAAAALAGRQVHVVTVNDYLAARDHAITRPAYARLQIEADLVVHETPAARRREAYGAPVVYVSNKELAFDFLRDRTLERTLDASAADLVGGEASGRRRLQGLDRVIVDEADSVLIDEARTPLILSGEVESLYDAATCRRALSLAAALEIDRHFRLDARRREVRLTTAGRRRLEALVTPGEGRWSSPLFREEATRQALAARHLFRRDVDYLVRDGKVRIVDEHSGRVFADRAWSMGLHQLMEVKEALEPSPERVTLGRLTYQSFFRRYRHLAGMTGTIRDVAGEVWQVYGVRTAHIKTHAPSRRRLLPDRIFATEALKLAAVVGRVQDLHRSGAPVLVGARTVAASIALAERFAVANLPFRLLNADQDAAEASIIQAAGQAGSITIATNMAGRGTDIRPDERALAAGGLHVLLTERHDARRIDLQLIGRSARQGEPGVAEAYLALDGAWRDAARADALGRLLLALGGRVPRLGAWSLRRLQRRLERAHARARSRLLASERNAERTLAFTGERE
ncbi:MAG: hypothetical protein EA356_04845 [Geminicoccaceae bacterium]|nr:MAG: hypothetical protein EA356_04845 [Geminicoccaceae bacterium]